MITVVTEPAANSALQDNLWHIVTSDNSGETDFKYVFDIYVNGENKATVKQYPEPSNGKSYFDAGPIVRNSVTYAWFNPVGPTLNNVYCVQPSLTGEIALTYEIQYGEDFSGTTEFNLDSGSVLAYNYRPPLLKRRVNDISSKLNEYLTNRPLIIRAGLNENILIPIYTDDSGLTLKVDTYDFSNALIATTVDAAPRPTDGFYQLNIGSAAINDTIGSEIINETVRYYDVYFNSYEKVRVWVECANQYTPIPLHFMNAWGMFDTARFGLASRLNMEVERKSFSQRDYTLGASSVDYYDANNVYRESEINYGNRASHNYKLTMEAPTDGDYQWLNELILSPQIYAEIDGYQYPVTLRTNNYEYSTQQNNRMRVLEVEIDLNQPRYSHAR